jgi:hypothetical protein
MMLEPGTVRLMMARQCIVVVGNQEVVLVAFSQSRNMNNATSWQHMKTLKILPAPQMRASDGKQEG